MTKHLNRLDRVQTFALMKLIETEYAELKLTDEAFAAQATTKLGFDVTVKNIANARKSMNIASTADSRPPKLGPYVIENIHTRITQLTERLNSYDLQVGAFGESKAAQDMRIAELETQVASIKKLLAALGS